MQSERRRKIDYEALARFRYEIRRFLNFSGSAARAAGLEPQQHQALLAIEALPSGLSPTVGALAERLQIHHNSAVELSRRLQSKGLVERIRGDSDARVVFLRLTPRGRSLLERLSLSHRAELRDAGPRLIAALRAAISHGVASKERPKNRRTSHARPSR